MLKSSNSAQAVTVFLSQCQSIEHPPNRWVCFLRRRQLLIKLVYRCTIGKKPDADGTAIIVRCQSHHLPSQILKTGEKFWCLTCNEHPSWLWIFARSHVMPDTENFDQLGFKFLINDLDLALTMTELAFSADANSNKRVRNTSNARKAYDTVVHLRKKVNINSGEEEEFNAKLGQLKSALMQLGEIF